MRFRNLLASLVLLLFADHAQAHFLWLVPRPAEQQAEVYFSEGAEPDDPSLLQKLPGLKIWTFGERNGPHEHATEIRDAALVASIGQSQTAALRYQYGKINRRGENVLLNYYAKGIAHPLSGGWKAVEDIERLPFEIVPNQSGDRVTLLVTWQGKPLPGATVILAGAGLESTELTTDNAGAVSCRPTQQGLLQSRAKHTVMEQGEFDGQKYDSIRHWTTLTVPYHPQTMQSLPHQLAPLARGVTSFGAAVAGDWLYLYGGQIGGAHHYWREGQSPDFQRLNLRSGTAWEPLPGGPRRTGTAMVEHRGQLYRIGGFEARNDKEAPEDMHSMPDVQRFDPALKEWHSLPDMPSGRSSHDAAVVGDTLYVVGGWKLAGKERTWHTDMWSLDLAAADAQWQAHPVPFRRRALSASAHNGKLYVLGGIQEDGETATAVDIFDPATGQWSSGPRLWGGPLEAFGNSSFAWGGKLRATTMSGAVQELSDDGQSWQVVGQLQHRRFFHRLLAAPEGRGVVVGGADMERGKVLELEVLGPAAATP